MLIDSEKLYLIRIYDLEKNPTFREFKIEGERIIGKEVHQNNSGTIFAFAYLDAGQFKILVFHKDGEIADVFVNKYLQIDDSTQPIPGIQDPLISICFINDDLIFVNLLKRNTMQHWYFIYSISARDVITKPQKIKMKCSKLNFPYQTIYNSDKNCIHLFYRQGESFCYTLNQKRHKRLSRKPQELMRGRSVESLNKNIKIEQDSCQLLSKQKLKLKTASLD